MNPNKKFWKDKKVLITGHNGFKGSWLSLWLLKLKSEICGISLSTNGENLYDKLNIDDLIESHTCDIREKDKVSKIINSFCPDILIHLAAQPLVLDSYKDPIKTWETNVIGTANILNSLNSLNKKCASLFITTDKVYENKEWLYGYREDDRLGGHDPYSASKAACELTISSWRKSFSKSSEKENLLISSARAGNVIGGGDWAENRIIPDIVSSLIKNQTIELRNPNSIRPWQHVLEPLSGYLLLLEKLYSDNKFAKSYNFGPEFNSNKKVIDLVEESLKYWQGTYLLKNELQAYKEANILKLNIEKAKSELNWYPKWGFKKTVEITIKWYQDFYLKNKDPNILCNDNIEQYIKDE